MFVFGDCPLLFLGHLVDVLLDVVDLLLPALDLSVQFGDVVEQGEVLGLLLQEARNDGVDVVQLGDLLDAVERLLVLVQRLQVRLQRVSHLYTHPPSTTNSSRPRSVLYTYQLLG